MENQESPEKSWAKAMLKLDLEMQSGAIWIDEKTGLHKEEKEEATQNESINHLKQNSETLKDALENKPKCSFTYQELDSDAIILDSEPVKYGNHLIQDRVQILR
ncbi:hypothetical protein [Chryseobacterium cucumeris]|uniref:hypothetical protein n=1 Tax=Chryseobacterium cucumeris TaxID=1813611 RepID=UPI001F4B398B|nr:hypothetical protein [Chryseobacterium cucumeris]